MNEVNILTQEKPRTIKLADGKDYKLSPLNLNIMAEIEEEFGCDFVEVSKQFLNEKTRSFNSLRKLIYIILRQNHPDFTITDVGKLIELNELPNVYQAIINAWGNR